MAKKPAAATGTGFSFSSAPVATIVTAAPAGKRATVPVDGVADYAALRYMRDLLDVEIAELGDKLETAGRALYIEQGCAKKSRPENVTGTEAGHTATLILGKKSTRSVLSDDEAALLDSHNLPYDTETSAETFSFNNDCLADPAMRSKIEHALSTIEVPAGMTLIERHPAGPTKRMVSDATLAKVFELPPEICETVLPVVTIFSLRPKWSVVANNLAPMIERVARLMNLPGMAERLISGAEAAEKKSSRRKAA